MWHSKFSYATSSEDGGIGRYILPPCTTKRRTTTNLKTKINPNWQKIELYVSLTTKELKKKHSSRLVGGAEIDSQGRRGLWERQWLVEWAVPHLCIDKPGGTTGEPDRLHNPGFQCREIKPQNLWLKTSVGVAVVGETPSLTGEFIGEIHKVLEHTQNHPPRNQHQKGPICLWVVVEVTESQWRTEQVVLFPLRPPPQRTAPQCREVGCPTLGNI